VTCISVDRLRRRDGDTDEAILRMARGCADAVATEIVAMTEDGYAAFVLKHGGRPLYPTLAAYPAPRG
jgi:hypothetical protein